MVSAEQSILCLAKLFSVPKMSSSMFGPCSLILAPLSHPKASDKVICIADCSGLSSVAHSQRRVMWPERHSGATPVPHLTTAISSLSYHSVHFSQHYLNANWFLKANLSLDKTISWMYSTIRSSHTHPSFLLISPLSSQPSLLLPSFHPTYRSFLLLVVLICDLLGFTRVEHVSMGVEHLLTCGWLTSCWTLMTWLFHRRVTSHYGALGVDFRMHDC